MHMLTKRYVTLIEMMIVMFLIALITGVIAYNYKGTLDEGKAFKTKTGIDKLETILNLAAANNPELLSNISQWKEAVKTSPMVQNATALINDGWGEEYKVEVSRNGTIKVTSDKYTEYVRTHPGSMFKEERSSDDNR